MVPTNFDGSNGVLDKPEDMDREECTPLCVQFCAIQPEGLPVTMSCWKLEQEELEEIKRTGRVWLSVVGIGMPPVILSVAKPVVAPIVF